jgi:hypothetical protein
VPKLLVTYGIVAHLGCKINNGKMWGVASCQHQGPVVKAMFSRCGSVWPTCSDEVLDDYVMARGRCNRLLTTNFMGVQSNANDNKPISSSPALLLAREAVYKRTPKPHIDFQCQMDMKKDMQNSKKYRLDTKLLQSFYETKIPNTIICHPEFIKVVKGNQRGKNFV